MGLYNALFGVNPRASAIVEALNLDFDTIPRFRDAHIAERDGQPVVAVYTRMGAGNRGHWEFFNDEGKDDDDCACPGCRAIELTRHPLYLTDEDDDFDPTYATYYFAVPDGLNAPASKLLPEQLWQAMFNQDQTDASAGEAET